VRKKVEQIIDYLFIDFYKSGAVFRCTVTNIATMMLPNALNLPLECIVG